MYLDSLKEQAEKLNLDKEDGSAVAAQMRAAARVAQVKKA